MEAEGSRLVLPDVSSKGFNTSKGCFVIEKILTGSKNPENDEQGLVKTGFIDALCLLRFVWRDGIQIQIEVLLHFEALSQGICSLLLGDFRPLEFRKRPLTEESVEESFLKEGQHVLLFFDYRPFQD